MPSLELPTRYARGIRPTRLVSYSTIIQKGYSIHEIGDRPGFITVYPRVITQAWNTRVRNNIPGSEMETLVKAIKSAGTYEMTWNAVKQPSGIYSIN